MPRPLIIPASLLVLTLLGAGCWPKTKTNTNSTNGAIRPSNVNDATNTGQPPLTFTFSDPKKSAHYESNTPAHGAILPAPPVNVVINFNFDLSTKSSIAINKDGQEYGTGETTVDGNKLTLRHGFNGDAPDGLYTVTYNACWPDGSCHDGSFQFAIDRSSAASAVDLTNQGEITIRLKDLAFSPRLIRIWRGTTVTWVNDDSVDHYINTDSHPAHTYFLEQNSSALKNGQSFSQTFSRAGVYPYHCSAHAGFMTGTIIVEPSVVE
ncbi:MAG: copper resistance protein CopC [Candidatus Kerfeldbacteria bacterium]|nr:copper resistance protein CopC [Candidatus Kerfeldbacteria bacterium]